MPNRTYIRGKILSQTDRRSRYQPESGWSDTNLLTYCYHSRHSHHGNILGIYLCKHLIWVAVTRPSGLVSAISRNLSPKGRGRRGTRKNLKVHRHGARQGMVMTISSVTISSCIHFLQL